jgi:TetR/AcrR family transcriptional regulator, cholesterol catabolism regulator
MSCETVDRKRQHGRSHIVAAALEIAVGGYGAVHVRSVAERAGVSTGTIYRFFSSKDDLLVACLQHWLTECADVSAPVGTDRYGALVQRAADLTRQLCAARAFADAVTRAYLYASGTAVTNAELVRRTLVRLFAETLGAAPGTRDHAIAELVTDCWATNVVAVTQNRLSIDEIGRRLEHTVGIVRSA